MSGYYLVVDNSRRANETTCRCGAIVTAGIDADRCALNAAADPTPLNRTGELLAVIAGRRTYAVDRDRRLHRRNAWSLARPAREPVLAEHRCGHPIPDHWLAPEPPQPATATDTEEPGF